MFFVRLDQDRKIISQMHALVVSGAADESVEIVEVFSGYDLHLVHHIRREPL